METRTRQRAQQVIIDTPKSNGPITIRVNLQNVDVDDDNNIVNETPMIKQIYKFADRIAYNTVTIYDPVMGENITLSVAGVHEAICHYVADWVKEDDDSVTLDGSNIWL